MFERLDNENRPNQSSFDELTHCSWAKWLLKQIHEIVDVFARACGLPSEWMDSIIFMEHHRPCCSVSAPHTCATSPMQRASAFTWMPCVHVFLLWELSLLLIGFFNCFRCVFRTAFGALVYAHKIQNLLLHRAKCKPSTSRFIHQFLF